MPDEARAAEAAPETKQDVAVAEDQSGLLEEVIRRTYKVPPPLFAIPTSWESVETMARKICRAGWCPKSHCHKDGTPNQASIELAILQGMEVGAPPLMAVQGIAIINGVPAIWGDLMLALVSASGLLEFKEEYYEKEDDDGATAVCKVKRAGRPNVVVRKYSMKMAKRAGLASKTGPWQTNPLRQLQMRARAFALRDEFADVLKGLYSAEELISDPDALERAIDTTTAPAAPTRADFQQPVNKDVNNLSSDSEDDAHNASDHPEPYELVDCDGEAKPYQQAGRYAKALAKVFDEAAARGVDVLDGMWETNSPTFGRLRGEGRTDLVDELHAHYGKLRNGISGTGKPADAQTDDGAQDTGPTVEDARTATTRAPEADGPPPEHPASGEMF